MGAFLWTAEDTADLEDLHVILAADVIYDNDLTEDFMGCMERFLKARCHLPGDAPGLLMSCDASRSPFDRCDVSRTNWQVHRSRSWMVATRDANPNLMSGLYVLSYDGRTVDWKCL
jgi:hypothetical protein